MDLYRGKEKKTGDWIIGAAVFIGEKAHILGSENLFPERPAYHSMAVGAGLEDECITDRYDAAAYGWTEALDRYEENFPIWIEVIPETVTKCTDRHDITENVLFEGDLVRDKKGIVLEICYGRYFIQSAKGKVSDNTGFFTIKADETVPQKGFVADNVCPLGTTEEEVFLVGNVFDNPELIQSAGRDTGQDADQPTLRPAT
ncbi:MAG: hypothetical protein K2K07_10640 [Lachnospiraceae bacterium]|nr:hypothetical protein [Lachnospiraceae bacterium]